MAVKVSFECEIAQKKLLQFCKLLKITQPLPLQKKEELCTIAIIPVVLQDGGRAIYGPGAF